jgi:outer membrane lipoprotein LolB
MIEITKWINVLVVSCFVLTMAACSTITPKPSAPTVQIPWKDRQTSLSNIHSWRLNGKIAVQTTRDSGSATVDWVQNRNQFSISLLGPLGSNGLKLSGQPGRVNLQTSDGKNYSASSPEQLLAEKWGFHLPVSNMNYWIRGLPAPGPSANTRFDSYGRLSELVQQGWDVQYQSYSHIGRMELPERISITSSSLKVKIVVYQWNVG